MYCRNCGKEVNEKAGICVHCGVRPLAERKFCQECGAETKPNQELCTKCGVRLKTLMAVTKAGIPIKTDFSGLSQYYQDEFKKIYESCELYKGKWNWWAFFFGVFWTLTKGVWLASVICIVASIFTCGIAGVIYSFIFGARGEYMYYCAYVKNKQLLI
jgi:RNA polymerase subunit RPABC4/transcription elongation factor Spt4